MGKNKIITGMLLSPFLPLALLYNNFKSKDIQKKIWSLILLFIIIGSTLILEEKYDGYRHLHRVIEIMPNISFYKFIEVLYNIFTLSNDFELYKDPYNFILSYLIGGVLKLPTLYFPVVAFIYGYYFSYSVYGIIENNKIFNKNIIFVIIFFTFISVRAFEGFQSVRMFTGMWVLFYALMNYSKTNRIKYIVLALLVPAIHIGFIGALFPVILWVIWRNIPSNILIVLFLISTLTNVIDIKGITINNPFFETDVGNEMKTSYYRDNEKTNVDKVGRPNISNERIWMLYINMNLQKYAVNILIIGIFLSGIFPKKMNTFEKRFFTIGLMLMITANLVWFITEFSSRIWQTAMVIILGSFVRISFKDDFKAKIWNNNKKLRIFSTVSALWLLPFIFYKISLNFDILSVYSFFFPIILWINPTANVSIKEFLRYFI